MSESTEENKDWHIEEFKTLADILSKLEAKDRRRILMALWELFT